MPGGVPPLTVKVMVAASANSAPFTVTRNTAVPTVPLTPSVKPSVSQRAMDAVAESLSARLRSRVVETPPAR